MPSRAPALILVAVLAIFLSVTILDVPCIASDSPTSVTAKVMPPAGNSRSVDNASIPGKKESVMEPDHSVPNRSRTSQAFAPTEKEQSDTEPTFSWGGYFKAIGMLFLVLALLWYIVWYLKRKGALPGVSQGSLPKGALRIEGSLPVGPRKGLLVVRFLNQRLLLGVTDHQITLITELRDNEADTIEPRQATADEPDNTGQRRNIDFEAIIHAIKNRKNTPAD